MRASRPLLLALALSVAFPALRHASAQTRTTKTLDIYVVDVEGGNATLFVSPSGESVLIDSGNGAAAAPRDAGQQVAGVRAGRRSASVLMDLQAHRLQFGGYPVGA